MRGRLCVFVVAGLAVSAAGCSSGGGAPTASGRPSASASSPTPSTAPSIAPPSPTPSQAPAQGAPLGTEYTFDDTAHGVTVKVTATSYKVVTLTGENQELLPAGAKIGLVGARVCVVRDASGAGVGLTWNPWSLVTAQGEAYTPVSAYGQGDWPGPLYPNDASLTYHVGTCRAGLIPVHITGGDVPVQVEYNTQGGVYDWRLR